MNNDAYRRKHFFDGDKQAEIFQPFPRSRFERLLFWLSSKIR